MSSDVCNCNLDGYRLEIAICQEEIDSFKPGVKKFTIPTMMTSNSVGNISTDNRNISNKSIGTLSSSTISLDNTISLEIPTYATIFYGKRKIPKGAKFLVGFAGANINDPIVLRMYDKEVTYDG